MKKVGKYRVKASFKIVNLTRGAVEDINKLLAKEEGNKHG